MQPQAETRRVGRPCAGRLEELDVLRGVAVLMVLVGNIPFNLFAWPSSLAVVQDNYWNGSAGVDLFLTVTGFTTARALLPIGASRVPARPPVVAFLIRRFWRRTVLAWIWIAIPVGASLLLGRSSPFRPVGTNVASGLAALLEAQNLWSARTFDTGGSGILFPYWTLSLGTQFALLLPLLSAACGRWLAWMLTALLAYDFLMPQDVLCFYTRPGALALGALLSIASADPDYRLGTPRFLCRAGVRGPCLAAAILVLGALQSSLLRPLVSVTFGLAALVAGALVYAASFDAGYVAGAGVVRRIGASLGRRSYAIYLTHVPAFALTRTLYARVHPSLGDPTARQAEHILAVALVLTAIASETSYRLVQCPGERQAAKFRARSADLT